MRDGRGRSRALWKLLLTQNFHIVNLVLRPEGVDSMAKPPGNLEAGAMTDVVQAALLAAAWCGHAGSLLYWPL